MDNCFDGQRFVINSLSVKEYELTYKKLTVNNLFSDWWLIALMQTKKPKC